MLSSRLNAFVIPTSQKSAIDDAEDVVRDELDAQTCGDRDPGGAELRRRAWQRGSGGGRRRSARRRSRIRAPARIPASSQDASTAPTATASAAPAARPAAIPTPPNVGVARSCQRSPVGCATRRRPTDGERRRAQSTKDATGSAATVTAALTAVRVAPAPSAVTPRLRPRWPAGPCVVPGAGHGDRRPYNRAVHVYGDLLRYRELFGSLFRRDLRAKYKGSVLGLAWTLALPLALMLVYLVVFSVLWRAEATDLDDYWLFLLCGLPPWVFLAASLQTGARSLVENAPLIRKVRFPRQLVPLSAVATQLVAFAMMTVIVLGLALWFRPESRDTAWLALPVAAVIVLFVGGLTLAVAALNAVFRDVEFIVAARAAAVVLPDAGALPARGPARRGVEAVARRPAPLGEPDDARDRGLSGRRSTRASCRRRPTPPTSASRRSSRSLLGALVVQRGRRPDRVGSVTTARPSKRPSPS